MADVCVWILDAGDMKPVDCQTTPSLDAEHHSERHFSTSLRTPTGLCAACCWVAWTRLHEECRVVFSELADFSPCSTGWEHIRITVTTSAVKKKKSLVPIRFFGPFPTYQWNRAWISNPCFVGVKTSPFWYFHGHPPKVTLYNSAHVW
jgi:hypothetical protein